MIFKKGRLAQIFLSLWVISVIDQPLDVPEA